VRNQRGEMVDKTHLLDYATHEVPLPLFGLGHDCMHLPWSASTPLWASMSSRVHIVMRLHPIGFGHERAGASVNFVSIFFDR